MQTSLIAGDTLAFNTTAPTDADGNSYKGSDGWTMSFRLVPRDSALSPISFAATADGDDYTVSVSSATTATWSAGWYSWAAYVSKDGTRYTCDSGQIEIKPDPAAASAGHDGRGHARRVLDAIEAVLESRASLDQKSVTIGDRSLERTPIEDLLRLRRQYQAEVAREDAAARLAAGLAPRNRIYVRL